MGTPKISPSLFIDGIVKLRIITTMSTNPIKSGRPAKPTLKPTAASFGAYHRRGLPQLLLPLLEEVARVGHLHVQVKKEMKNN